MRKSIKDFLRSAAVVAVGSSFGGFVGATVRSTLDRHNTCSDDFKKYVRCCLNHPKELHKCDAAKQELSDCKDKYSIP